LTLVRIVDKVIASPAPGTSLQEGRLPPFLVSLTLVVILRAGGATGDYTVAAVPMEPNGTRLPPVEAPVSFGGADPGQAANVVINMNLGVQHDGLYWFDILLNGKLVSRVPLRIEYRPAEDPPPPVPQVSGTGE
jgi:hypothetical protein